MPSANQGDLTAALGGMAQVGNPRVPMGIADIAALTNRSGEPSKYEQSHPRFSQPYSDPAYFPTARPKPALHEPGGATYGIKVRVPTLTLPEAAQTQRNGRLIRGRGTGGSFAGGAAG